VPDNPGAWLMTTAKNRARDRLRSHALHAQKHEQIGLALQALQADVEPDFVDALDAARRDDIGDDVLRLVFTACHPVLSVEARVALTLRGRCATKPCDWAGCSPSWPRTRARYTAWSR